ncbi:hypothetical protein SCYAM73S_03333 [Streptomyces cyaneofuscatus]
MSSCRPWAATTPTPSPRPTRSTPSTPRNGTASNSTCGLRPLRRRDARPVRGRRPARLVHGRPAPRRPARPRPGRRPDHSAGPGAAGRGTRAGTRACAAAAAARVEHRRAARRASSARRRTPLFAPFATATAAAASSSPRSSPCRPTGRRHQRPPGPGTRDRHALPLRTPAQHGGDGRGRIGVIASATEGRAVVTLGGYRAPPGGRVHQSRLMRPGAQPRSLGLFEGDTPLVATGLGPPPPHSP